MINKEIIKLASNTSNVGLGSRYSHRISMKNSICGDKITLGIIASKKKITSMNYETNSSRRMFFKKYQCHFCAFMFNSY